MRTRNAQLSEHCPDVGRLLSNRHGRRSARTVVIAASVVGDQAVAAGEARLGEQRENRVRAETAVDQEYGLSFRSQQTSHLAARVIQCWLASLLRRAHEEQAWRSFSREPETDLRCGDQGASSESVGSTHCPTVPWKPGVQNIARAAGRAGENLRLGKLASRNVRASQGDAAIGTESVSRNDGRTE